MVLRPVEPAEPLLAPRTTLHRTTRWRWWALLVFCLLGGLGIHYSELMPGWLLILFIMLGKFFITIGFSEIYVYG